jgi:hypothetical protein
MNAEQQATHIAVVHPSMGVATRVQYRPVGEALPNSCLPLASILPLDDLCALELIRGYAPSRTLR